jgi:hypothetical protein
VEQGAGNCQFLLHTAAPAPDDLRTPIPQLQAGEQFFDTGFAFVCWHTPDFAIKVQVVFGTQALVQAIMLEKSAAVEADRISLGADVEAQDARGSVSWSQQA